MRHLLVSTALALIPLTGSAQDAALVLGNEYYEQLGRLSRGAEVVQATDGLEALGFAVEALPNGRAAGTAVALETFTGLLPEGGRIVVALSGRFATDGTRTWLLTAEADEPSLLTLGSEAVSVESLLAVLAEAPAQALLLLATERSDTVFDPWLREGIGTLEIPQGVTVLQGNPRDVAAFMADELSIPGGDLAALVAENGRLSAQGYLPRRLLFMPTAATRPPVIPPVIQQDTRAEDALWQGAVALDTVDAYRNYLSRYPLGAHADQAEQAIAAILAEPYRDARLAEEALNLSRDQRRAVQRNLATLDFDPRGIDGIFGSGTRRAIANWQQQNGYAQSGYMTVEQINRLDAQAARRAAEIAAEAERQAAEAARLDRAYWDETGARGDEAGLRAYLSRFPDGDYASTARARLDEITRAEQEVSAAADRAAVRDARQIDTIEAWNRYLRDFPRGAYRGEAEARIAVLSNTGPGTGPDGNQGGGQDADRARADEAALGLNALTARMVESRLEQMGLNPGEVDGQFDQNTRRAIARYQEARNLPETGYINDITLIRLLADSLQRID